MAVDRHVVVAGAKRHLSGWKKEPYDPRDKMLAAPGFIQRLRMSKEAEVPLHFKVENQSNIGSCTCNSGSSMEEHRIWVQEQKDVQLSRLWLYAQVRKEEGTPLIEDSGAYNRTVMKVLSKYGCPDESLWPYDLSKWSVSPPDALLAEAAKYKAAYYYKCPNLWAMKASIGHGYPVLMGFAVPKRTTWKDDKGYIAPPEPNEPFDGGHAVLAVGYSDTKRRVKFLNSWGTEWGDGGYGYLDYWYWDKGLVDDMWSLRSVEVT